MKAPLHISTSTTRAGDMSILDKYMALKIVDRPRDKRDSFLIPWCGEFVASYKANVKLLEERAAEARR